MNQGYKIVNVKANTHADIKELSNECGMTMADFVEKLVVKYKKKKGKK